MTWEQLRQWVNDPTRTVVELQQACVAIGIIVPAAPAPTATSLRNRLKNHIVSQPDLTATSPWTPTPPPPPGVTPAPVAAHQPPWWQILIMGLVGAIVIGLVVAGLIWAWRNIPSASPAPAPAKATVVPAPVQRPAPAVIATSRPAPQPTTAPAVATAVPIAVPTAPTAAPAQPTRPQPVGWCQVPAKDQNQQSLNWDGRLRLWMSDRLVADLKRSGGHCSTDFGVETPFTLNSVEGVITLDGKRVSNGNGLSLRGTRLVIDYNPGNGSNGFDTWFVD